MGANLQAAARQFYRMFCLRRVVLKLYLALCALCIISADHRGDKYLLGAGKADITGPVVEIGMMGYAAPDQKGTGLRQRLFSRAFIVGNAHRPKDRFLYVIADLQSGDTAVRDGVLKKLQLLYPGIYTQSNVAIVGTHNHAGPGQSGLPLPHFELGLPDVIPNFTKVPGSITFYLK